MIWSINNNLQWTKMGTKRHFVSRQFMQQFPQSATAQYSGSDRLESKETCYIILHKKRGAVVWNAQGKQPIYSIYNSSMVVAW
mmetsp:Transcript_14075/g.29186  ORF Transcript_14075/g.29186 Transcript_14075/m.29186 type:complete len:83 (+) Transcript_14075:372-620(+)